MKKFREDFSVFRDANGEYFPEQSKQGDLEEVKLSVRRPNHLEKAQADFEYNKQMNKLLQNKIMPRNRLEEVIKENGTWDSDKDRKENELIQFVTEARKKLRKGGIKISEAAKVAKDSIKKNFEWLDLNGQKNEILSNSAESISEQHRFNWLTSSCTVYNDSVGNRFFKDHEDFLRQDSFGNPVPNIAGAKLSRLLYNMEEDFRADWPEYQFLKKHGFVNDKFQLVNKDNKLVDETGKELEIPETVVEVKEPEFLPDDVITLDAPNSW